MATVGHTDGLSFGMERILRLDSPTSARQGRSRVQHHTYLQGVRDKFDPFCFHYIS